MRGISNLLIIAVGMLSSVIYGQNLNESLIVTGLPKLSNGWWLYEDDSREVSQYWGGLESYHSNPPGGLIYKAEYDLNGDGSDEVILRWTVVGNTWEVYRRSGDGGLKHTGTLGSQPTLQIKQNDDGTASFRSYQIGPDRSATIYEYAITKNLDIEYNELGSYKASDGLMPDDIDAKFQKDIAKYLGDAKQVSLQKALMLSLLNELDDPWEKVNGAFAGNKHWSSQNLQQHLRTLDEAELLSFEQSRATIIDKLGSSFQPKVHPAKIRLTSLGENGELIQTPLDQKLIERIDYRDPASNRAISNVRKEVSNVPENSNLNIVLTLSTIALIIIAVLAIIQLRKRAI